MRQKAIAFIVGSIAGLAFGFFVLAPALRPPVEPHVIAIDPDNIAASGSECADYLGKCYAALDVCKAGR